MTIRVAVVTSEDEDKFYINKAYIDFALLLGEYEDGVLIRPGIPNIVLNPSDIRNYDTLLLTGGRDINPMIFNRQNYNSNSIYTEMDLRWISMVEEAVSNGLNIFGICRGFQLLAYMYFLENNADIVRMTQHINGHNQSDRSIQRKYTTHEVQNLTTNEVIKVNSMHHQAVTLLPKKIVGMDVIYHTTYRKIGDDTIIEGIKFKLGDSKIMGVQWHPEELTIEENKDILREWNADDFLNYEIT